MVDTVLCRCGNGRLGLHLAGGSRSELCIQVGVAKRHVALPRLQVRGPDRYRDFQPERSAGRGNLPLVKDWTSLPGVVVHLRFLAQKWSRNLSLTPHATALSQSCFSDTRGPRRLHSYPVPADAPETASASGLRCPASPARCNPSTVFGCI